jgi:hypothetical protein
MRIDGMTSELNRALLEFAERSGKTKDNAAVHIMRDWLTCHGYLERPNERRSRHQVGRITPDGRDVEQVQYPSYYENDGSL